MNLQSVLNQHARFVLASMSIFVIVSCGDGSSIVQSEPETAVGQSLGYNRINETNANDPLDAQIFELDNGLKVYLTENHEEPRFYAEIAVRAGSKHDPSDGTGLAHYLEHLLFKGNQNLGTLNYEAEKPYLDEIVNLYEEHFSETDEGRRAEIYSEINRAAQLAAEYAVPNEIDKIYNSMGGTGLNAHTWYEETVYKIGLPSNRLQQWAEIESDRFVNPVFRLFHTELETVYEEKNRSLDNAGRIICTAIAFLLGTEVLKELSPFTVSISINLEPIYAIILALCFFGDSEIMSIEFYIGAAIILATIVGNAYLKANESS